jgi:ribosomal protein S12 methylthiotransferase
VDSEVFMGHLQKGPYEVQFESTETPDIAVINTCGFIKDAKQESIDIVLDYIEAKKRGEVERVYVMGCLTERYREEIRNEMPELEGVYGVNEISKIVEDLEVDYQKELFGERKVTTPKHYAYLKVSEGCDRTCSFCAIPLIRGKHKSRTIESLVAEANDLVAKGVKELILIAQDLTYYGIDIYGKKELANLLTQLSDIEGVEWIRLHYTFPTQFPEEVIELMKERKNICNYIDIPLQHIDDTLLKSMKRGHTSESTKKLIKMFRERIPNLSIRSTFIVGYPGETEEAFQALKEFIQESKFNRLGVFTYSEEEDTSAALLEDDVPEEVKEARMEEIMELQAGISLEWNEAKVGKEMRIIIDREEDDFFIGRTEYDSPEVDNEVLIEKNDQNLEIGKFYQVKITNAEMFDIFAEVI